jgi:hypothetical protein
MEAIMKKAEVKNFGKPDEAIRGSGGSPVRVQAPTSVGKQMLFCIDLSLAAC